MPDGTAENLHVAQAKAPLPESEALPYYLTEIYNWCYVDPDNCRRLDNEAIVMAILWGQHRRLRRATLAEVTPGQRVLLPAHVYGDFPVRLARHVGPKGRLVVSDVNPVQLSICEPKLAPMPWVSVQQTDARFPMGGPFDTVVCYFLTHELPDDYKHSVVTALLDSLAPGGKAVFVDYHRPHRLHPLRPVMSQIFDRLEPFAKTMWRHEIADFAADRDAFSWRKETFFGGMYQKVVAERR